MQTIAIVSQKGGSGKTTLAQNLAVLFENSVLVDLDSQPTSANWGDRREDAHPSVVSAQPARLPAILKTARESGVGVCVIDTPPRTSEAALDAARASDVVLVPVRPAVNDLETLPALAELLVVARKRAFVVISCAPTSGSHAAEATKFAETLGFTVVPTTIHQRITYAYAPRNGLGVTEYEPESKAAHEMRLVYKFACELLNMSSCEGACA